MIYVISDIHGNIDALKSFFKEAKPSKKDQIYALGDYVGYYYWPKKCLDLLLKKKVICIRGNHDKNFLKAKKNIRLFTKYSKKYGYARKELDKELGKKYYNFLNNMQNNHIIKLNGYRIRLSHGSPWKNDEYVYSDCPNSILRKFLKYKENIFFIGHTHRKMKKKYKDKIIYNPGSIGQPRDQYSKANWIEFDPESKKVKFCYTKYKTKKLIKKIYIKDQDKFLKLSKYVK